MGEAVGRSLLRSGCKNLSTWGPERSRPNTAFTMRWAPDQVQDSHLHVGVEWLSGKHSVAVNMRLTILEVAFNLDLPNCEKD